MTYVNVSEAGLTTIDCPAVTASDTGIVWTVPEAVAVIVILPA